MKNLMQGILDWSEVWAPLIPLAILWFIKPKQKWITPVKWYLVIAFFVNLTGNLIWYRIRFGMEGWMQENLSSLYNADGSFNNTVLYNIHSISRFLFFTWFFYTLGRKFRNLNYIFIPLFLFLVVANFVFNEDIRDFSSLLLASEAAILLFYCLQYYLITLRDEDSPEIRPAHFWIVTGLSIYVVINFPIFLFYTALAKQAENFAIDIWDVHNISYIVFCIFIAKAFYGAKQ